MNNHLVGFLGYKGCGKSTAAEEAVKYGYVSIAMADPLKKAAMIMFALEEEHCQPETKEKPGPMGVSYREALTKLGTDVMRDRGKEFWPMMTGKAADHWVNLARLSIVAAMKDGKSVVVPDIRFANEVDMIHSLGGTVVWVHRGESVADFDGSSHASERAVLHCVENCLYDRELTNKGKKETFQVNVRDLLHLLKDD